MAFFQRIFNYLANEIIVRKLAENRSFQQFALRTTEAFRNFGQNAIENTTKSAANAAPKPKATTTSQQPSRPGFLGHLLEEIQKDLGVKK